jgi:hypothetical protein
MKKKNNENIDINTIMAMFVAYMQQQMDYTEMKMDAMTEWQTEDCGCSGCEKRTVAAPEDAQYSFDDEFSKEWL